MRRGIKSVQDGDNVLARKDEDISDQLCQPEVGLAQATLWIHQLLLSVLIVTQHTDESCFLRLQLRTFQSQAIAVAVFAIARSQCLPGAQCRHPPFHIYSQMI